MKFSQSILVSNIFDPLTHSKEELDDLYLKLSNLRRYKSIETRIITDKDSIDKFKEYADQNSWNVTYWVTGDVAREGLNPSSRNNEIHEKTILRLKTLAEMASNGRCKYFGIASGVSEGENFIEQELDQFESTIRELIGYCSKYEDMKIVFEPLDEFAHKKNVIGTTKRTYDFLQRFNDKDWCKTGKLSICWDSAHMALNEDDFEMSIKLLSPYISRIHFSNAVLDKESKLYGDWHMNFIFPGFMNIEVASKIIDLIMLEKDSDFELFVACEIRTKEKLECWTVEDTCFNFINSAISESVSK